MGAGAGEKERVRLQSSYRMVRSRKLRYIGTKLQVSEKLNLRSSNFLTRL